MLPVRHDSFTLNDAMKYVKSIDGKIVNFKEESRDKSYELKVVFNFNKSVGFIQNNWSNYSKDQKFHRTFSCETTNLTLWNGINQIDSFVGRVIAKILYISTIRFGLPIADWAIGQLRSEQQGVICFRKEHWGSHHAHSTERYLAKGFA